MKHVKLFENFDRLSENWETEITDIIKSDFRDLERDADNISKQDIDEVIQAYGRKHGEPDANYVDMFNFIGNYFGMEMQELQDMIEMGENKKELNEKWKDKMHKVYADLEEFKRYDEMYGLAKRLGFNSAEEAWDANPTIQGSTDPNDFKVVK